MPLVILDGDCGNGGREHRDPFLVGELERLEIGGDVPQLVFGLAAHGGERGIDGLCQGSHCHAPENSGDYRLISLKDVCFHACLSVTQATTGLFDTGSLGITRIRENPYAQGREIMNWLTGAARCWTLRTRLGV